MRGEWDLLSEKESKSRPTKDDYQRTSAVDGQGLERGLGWNSKERRVIIRAFEKTGISLKVDGSEDAEKMKFQGQEIGIPPGLEIWSIWLKIFYQKRWLGLRPKIFTNFFFK